MALIAASVVTATTRMGVTLSLATAAALQAGQVNQHFPCQPWAFGSFGTYGGLLCFAVASVIALDLGLQNSK